MVHKQHEIEQGAATPLGHLRGGSQRDRRWRWWPSPRQARTEDTAPAPVGAGKGEVPAPSAGLPVGRQAEMTFEDDGYTSPESQADYVLASTSLMVVVVPPVLEPGRGGPCCMPGRLWGLGRARGRGLRIRDRLPRGRLAASHVFASLKRLARGSAPGPRSGLRCAQSARKPCATGGIA